MGYSPKRPLWQAEGLGSVFENSRVRRIEQAQDALSLVEEKVYDLLWGPKNQQRDAYRLTHYSLQRLAHDARLNIKTVRELLPRLVDKGFIEIEREADVRRNIPTLYRVWSYGKVIENQRRRNRSFVAKTGKGVFYVHPVAVSIEPAQVPEGDQSTPMGLGPTGYLSEPVRSPQTPHGSASPGPLGARSARPLAPGGTTSIGIVIDNPVRHTTSVEPATYAALVAAIHEAFHADPDHALLAALIADSHRRALEATGEPATDDELLYFTRAKARVIAMAPNIRNHMAVLRKAVPECFTGQAFRLFREAAAHRKQREAEVQRAREAEAAEQERLRAEAERRFRLWTEVSERHRTEHGYDMQAIAADADLDDAGRRQANELMLRLGRYSPTGL
jgi:hypothetical protein